MYPVQITESAKTYLTNMKKTHNKKYIHLSVDSGGCSGFQYKWDFADTVEEGMLIDDIIVLDNLAEFYVIGSTVDYVTELGGSYLKVVNPNSKAQCGCGESFNV